MSEPLEMWTVYERPRDYPQGYVARLWLVHGPEPIATVRTLTHTRLSAIRDALQRKGLTCLPRSEGDEPQIVETWF